MKLRHRLILLCFLLSTLSPASAQTPSQVAQETFPSVVLLAMKDRQGHILALGSGFFVQQDLVATNLHVIQGASTGYAKIVGRDQTYGIAGYVAVDPMHDLVLLKVDRANTRPLVLGESEKLSIGDTVYAVGNPQGLEGTFSQGIVSGVREVGDGTVLQISAPISPGSSGGPVLNVRGEVVGVAVASFKGGQNLNFAIPSSYLKQVLADVRNVSPLSADKNFASKQPSIMGALVASGLQEVKAENMLWEEPPPKLSFTIRNYLRQTIKGVYYLAIFYDRRGNPIDFQDHRFGSEIPAGLGKRTFIFAPKDVYTLTDRVEIRFLDFAFSD